MLRSKLEDSDLANYGEVYKIGSTSQPTERRVAQAEKSATFLSGPVEIYEEFEMPKAMCSKVEKMLHKLFAPARLDIWFERDGVAVAHANEWFAVKFDLIVKAVELIENETITNCRYNPETEKLELNSSKVKSK